MGRLTHSARGVATNLCEDIIISLTSLAEISLENSGATFGFSWLYHSDGSQFFDQ